jgi:hypothetical protein
VVRVKSLVVVCEVMFWLFGMLLKCLEYFMRPVIPFVAGSENLVLRWSQVAEEQNSVPRRSTKLMKLVAHLLVMSWYSFWYACSPYSMVMMSWCRVIINNAQAERNREIMQNSLESSKTIPVVVLLCTVVLCYKKTHTSTYYYYSS